MEYKTSAKSNGTLEDLYNSMCNDIGVQPKTKDQLDKEKVKKPAKRKKVKKPNTNIRVVKKEKDGVVITDKKKVGKLSWDEFDRNYELISEKNKYLYRKKSVESIKESYINDAAHELRTIKIADRRNRNDNVDDNVVNLGNIIQKIKNLTGEEHEDVMKQIEEKYKQKYVK